MRNRTILLWLLPGIVLTGAVLYLLWRHPGGDHTMPPPPETLPGIPQPVAGLAPRDLDEPSAVAEPDILPSPATAAPVAPSPGEASWDVEGLQEREQAVAEWDALVDEILLRENVDVAAEAGRIKKAFDRMHPADRLEPLQQALIMLPDHQFPVMFDILLDLQQHPDVLEAIFDDALNREDDIKIPLMEALRQERDHPCFFEASRILDITGDPDF